MRGKYPVENHWARASGPSGDHAEGGRPKGSKIISLRRAGGKSQNSEYCQNTQNLYGIFGLHQEAQS